jgi:hypothetical protein
LGRRLEWHHPTPKVKGGRLVLALHPICHRAIHARFRNGELARIGADRETLLQNESLAAFIAWVADKPPDFHAPTHSRQR